MLDVGLSELLLVAIAAIVFLNPKDVPVVIRHVSRFLQQVKSLGNEVRSQLKEVAEESGIADMRTIIDLEGKERVAYDVTELETLKKHD